MLFITQKKVFLPEPLHGFTILRAAQLAIKSDIAAEFRTKPCDVGFVVRKVFKKSNVELIVEATGDMSIDTRLSYSDFVLNGWAPITGNVKDILENDANVIYEAERFANDIFQSVEVLRWKELPKLEYETCGWCPNKVKLTWDASESTWECRNHGYISPDFIVMEMIRPFLP